MPVEEIQPPSPDKRKKDKPLRLDCNPTGSKSYFKIRSVMEELMCKKQPIMMFLTNQAQHLTGA